MIIIGTSATATRIHILVPMQARRTHEGKGARDSDCLLNGTMLFQLVNWTKGFNASGVEDHDVVELLRDACHRRGVSFVFRV